MTRPNDDHNEDTRFRRLAAAVILQALDDLYKGSRRQRELAWNWLFGKSDDGLTFELCCKLLDRDAEDSRCKLEAYYRQAFSLEALAAPTGVQWTLGPASLESLVGHIDGGRQERLPLVAEGWAGER